MKKIGIAVTDPHDWTGVALCNAVMHYGMQPVKFSFSDATSNISSGKIYADRVDLTALDAVIVRDLGPATQNDVSFRFDILCHLKELGIGVINSPDSIAKAANKYVSSFLFQKNGIPTPETVITNSLNEALDALSSFGCAVVKPVFGYKGLGVECVKSVGKVINLENKISGKNFSGVGSGEPIEIWYVYREGYWIRPVTSTDLLICRRTVDTWFVRRTRGSAASWTLTAES